MILVKVRLFANGKRFGFLTIKPFSGYLNAMYLLNYTQFFIFFKNETIVLGKKG